MHERGPVPLPHAAHRVELSSPNTVGVLEALGDIVLIRAAHHQPRLRMDEPRPVGIHVRLEGVAAVAMMLGVAQKRQRRIDDAAAPEVPRRGAHRQGVVAADLEAEGNAAVERELRQQALAEAVDGEDVGAVQVPHRRRQQTFGSFFNSQVAPARGQFGRLIVFGVRRRLHRGQGVAQRTPQPMAQLARGGDGERHHQQPFNRQFGFDHGARRQSGQGVGLAGAGAGFDQQIAAE